MKTIAFDPTRTPVTPQVGCIVGEPDDFYHSVPGAVTSSRIGKLIRSPRLWFDTYEADEPLPTTPPTAALDFGRAYHCLVLEGREAFDERFAVCPVPIEYKGRNPGKQMWDAFKKAHAGKTLFDYDTGAQLEQMRERLMESHLARALIEQSTHELTWRGVDTRHRVLFQARTDGYSNGGQRVWRGRPFILDLKTAAEDDFRSFERSFRNARYGYHRQSALYRDVVEVTGGAKEADFIFVRQAKAPPYDVIVYDGVDADALAYGQREIRAAMEVLAECRASGVWPVAPQTLGPSLGLADYIYETPPEEAVKWIQQRGAEQVVSLAAILGVKPEALLGG